MPWPWHSFALAPLHSGSLHSFTGRFGQIRVSEQQPELEEAADASLALVRSQHLAGAKTRAGDQQLQPGLHSSTASTRSSSSPAPGGCRQARHRGRHLEASPPAALGDSGDRRGTASSSATMRRPPRRWRFAASRVPGRAASRRRDSAPRRRSRLRWTEARSGEKHHRHDRPDLCRRSRRHSRQRSWARSGTAGCR